MVKEIGFMGLGTVGRHMAINLLKGNYNLTVYDRQPDAVADLVRLGAKEAKTLHDVASNKDMVIIILPERQETEEMLSGDRAFLDALEPGTILVDMGTHSLEVTLELDKAAKERKALFLEAPVWGTKEHAANGLLTILAGGDETLLGRCHEPFSLLGLHIIHVGDVGDATRMKFVANVVQAELMQALAEGLTLGEKLGFSPEKIIEVLDSGGAASPLFNAKARSIARGNFSRNLALKYVYEGLQLAREAGEKEGLKLPAADAVSQIYSQALEQGLGEEDFSAVIKVLRK